MQRSGAATGEHGCTAEGMWLRRERELVAQLHELLFPSPAPSGGGASWTTSSSGLNVAKCLSSDECLPVISKEVPCEAAPAVSCGGRQRRRGALGKRVRGDEQDELEEQYSGDGANAKPRCSRRKKHGTRTLVTTVPDFDGYQWRKYGQKQIECAKYPRSYYRCTYSTDQGCPAKRTVQRNDDDDRNGGDGGGPPKYTVVYISEHTCKATESVAPVILETTFRTKKPPTAAASPTHVIPAAAAAPDNVAVVVPAAESPAISDITWSGGGDTNTTPSEEGDYSRVLGAVDDCHWDRRTTAPAAAALLQEMDLFAGPIRSPVHIAADGWMDDLFVNAPSVLNGCQLFG